MSTTKHSPLVVELEAALKRADQDIDKLTAQRHTLLAACEGALYAMVNEWGGMEFCETYTKPLEAAIAQAKC